MIKQPNVRWRRYWSGIMDYTKGEERRMAQARAEAYGELAIFIRGKMKELFDSAVIPGSDGKIDYRVIDRNWRKYTRQINTKIYSFYNTFGTVSHSFLQNGFFDYRSQMVKALVDIGFKPKNATKPLKEEVEFISEAEGDIPPVRVSFRGTPTDSFQHQLKQQYISGIDPKKDIKTISQSHQILVQKAMVDSVNKGKGFGWAKDQVLSQIYSKADDEAVVATAENNITRILRTTYRTAVGEDTMNFVGDNSDVFVGARRTADGRPCMACIIRDGEFIPPDGECDDHPNGMCIPVPINYPDEYFSTGKVLDSVLIPEPFGDSLVSEFYKYDDQKQKQILGTSLFNLWKNEDLDLSSLVNRSGTTKSYAQVLGDIGSFGAKSNPLVGFDMPQAFEFINPVLDPLDRRAAGRVISGEVKKFEEFFSDKKIPNSSTSVVGTHYGRDIIKDPSFSVERKASLLARYDVAHLDPKNWKTYNDFQREIGSYVRVSKNGEYYLSIPEEVLKAADNKFVPYHPYAPNLWSEFTATNAGRFLPETSPTFGVGDFLDNDGMVKLDTNINLETGTNLDKIRWNKEGNVAKVVIDTDVVDNQMINIIKMYDSNTDTYYYRFDLKVSKAYNDSFNKRAGLLRDNVVSVQIRDEKGRLVTKDILFPEMQKISEKLHDGSLSYYGLGDEGYSAYTGRVIVDVGVGKKLSLEESLSEFSSALENFDDKGVLGGVLKPTTAEVRKEYLKNRAKWADREYLEDSHYDGIWGERVSDNYIAPYLKIDEPIPSDIGILIHDVINNNPAVVKERVLSILDSETILSTDERLLRGIGGIDDGMSNTSDIASGGSNGVFTRIIGADQKIDAYSSGGARFIFDNSEFNRTDWYGFPGDSYGNVNFIADRFKGRKAYLNSAPFSRASNEQIFRGGINTKKIRGILIRDSQVRDDLITTLKNKGIREINGVELDKFIIKHDDVTRYAIRAGDFRKHVASAKNDAAIARLAQEKAAREAAEKAAKAAALKAAEEKAAIEKAAREAAEKARLAAEEAAQKAAEEAAAKAKAEADRLAKEAADKAAKEKAAELAKVKATKKVLSNNVDELRAQLDKKYELLSKLTEEEEKKKALFEVYLKNPNMPSKGYIDASKALLKAKRDKYTVEKAITELETKIDKLSVKITSTPTGDIARIATKVVDGEVKITDEFITDYTKKVATALAPGADAKEIQAMQSATYNLYVELTGSKTGRYVKTMEKGKMVVKNVASPARATKFFDAKSRFAAYYRTDYDGISYNTRSVDFLKRPTDSMGTVFHENIHSFNYYLCSIGQDEGWGEMSSLVEKFGSKTLVTEGATESLARVLTVKFRGVNKFISSIGAGKGGAYADEVARFMEGIRLLTGGNAKVAKKAMLDLLTGGGFHNDLVKVLYKYYQTSGGTESLGTFETAMSNIFLNKKIDKKVFAGIKQLPDMYGKSFDRFGLNQFIVAIGEEL